LEGVDFGEGEIYDILFVNADASAPVVFNVPTPGNIISPAQWWGYYLINDTDEGWYDVITESTWTRTSTDTAAPAGMKAVKQKTFHPGGRIFRR
jgi:hypothetical protein